MQKKKECQICLEDKINRNFIDYCQGEHNINFCKICVLNYIKAKIEENIIDIDCISTNCNKRVDMTKFLNSSLKDKELKEKYINLVKKYELLKKAYETKYISCESKKCDNIIKMIKSKEFIRCSKCKYKFCQYCKEKNHLFGCKNEERKKINYSIKEAKLRFCPNCDIQTERDGGCNIMTCSRCKKKFCWCCGVSTDLQSFYDHCSKMNLFYCPAILDFNPIVAKRKQIFNFTKYIFVLIFIICMGFLLYRFHFFNIIFILILKIMSSLFIWYYLYYKVKLKKKRFFFVLVPINIFYLLRAKIFLFIILNFILFIKYSNKYLKTKSGNFLRKIIKSEKFFKFLGCN